MIIYLTLAKALEVKVIGVRFVQKFMSIFSH